ncbi:amidohydrolase [Ferrovibrio sp.]|uniref:amidohydrolase n=1 Tax=Ferrovibrio sp. TaxID=1917215 RepID=UPI0025C20A22|nr:amidohydrolase [Ferrovibrio sp.]MBX3454640.1 amidohydrolase [Ferrovibrio sp.]
MPATTIITARKIITMNPGLPEASHVAIRDGRILAVGNAEDMKFWPDAVIDTRFADKVLMPGFVEGHSHIMEGSIWPYSYVGYFDRVSPDGVMVSGLKSIDAVVERLKAVSDAMSDPNAILFAWGFDPIYFNDRRMTRLDLDRVSTTRPVLIIHASFHIINTNSFTLQKVGIDRSTNIDGVPKDADGEPAGELQGPAARIRLFRGLQWNALSDSVSSDSVRRFSRSAVINGATTVTDLHNELTELCLADFRKETSAADFPMRLVPALSRIGATTEQIIERIGKLKTTNSEKLYFGMVKLVVDGSIQGFTGRLRWPGYHNGAENGLWYIAPNELDEIVGKLHAAHVHMHIHTNGDEATELAINAIEAAQIAHYWADHRHTLQHCQMASPAQFKRMKALGICANLFSNHIYYWGDQHYAITMGPERANRLNAAGTAKNLGVPFGLHSDAPVTPLRPLFTAWCAVNRITASGRLLGPDERLSVADALAGITIGPAYTMRMDHLVGSIETGKFADFVVLEQDPFAVDPMTLKDIPIWGTICGGQVFQAPKP